MPWRVQATRRMAKPVSVPRQSKPVDLGRELIKSVLLEGVMQSLCRFAGAMP
jgi:hypothetical protein